MSYLIFTFLSLGMFGFPPSVDVPATSFKGYTTFCFCFFSLLRPLAVVLLLSEASVLHKYTTYVSSMSGNLPVPQKYENLLPIIKIHVR